MRYSATEILNDRSSPLLMLADRLDSKVRDLDPENGKPWFGQLMAGTQLLAYLIQVDIWLREYKITIK